MIKKITSEEFDNLSLHGRGSTSPVYNAIISLKPGEALVMEKSSWKAKYAPTLIVKRIEKKYPMRFRRGALPDRIGWAVKRIS